MSISNSHWSRIGDQPFGLGLERFRNSQDQPLWRFQVTGQPGHKLVELDAGIGDLRAIIRWCETAIKTLETDGGRNVADEPEVAA